MIRRALSRCARLFLLLLGGDGRCRSNGGPGVVRSLLGNLVNRCLVIVVELLLVFFFFPRELTFRILV